MWCGQRSANDQFSESFSDQYLGFSETKFSELARMAKVFKTQLHLLWVVSSQTLLCIIIGTLNTNASVKNHRSSAVSSSTYHLPPLKEFHQTKRRGHHQQAIDEIHTLGLSAATLMATRSRSRSSTMVCWKRRNDEERWYVFFVGGT